MSADGRWVAVGGANQRVAVADLVTGQELFTLPPEGCDVWSLAWSSDGTKLAAGLSDGVVAMWNLEQVRARLTEFGLKCPSIARVEATAGTEGRIAAFDRVVELNRLRAEADEADGRAATARAAGDVPGEREHVRAAMKLFERLVGAAPSVLWHRFRLAGAHQRLAGLEDTAIALSHLDSESRLRGGLAVDNPGNPDHRRALARCMAHRARLHDHAGHAEEAEDCWRKAVAKYEILAADPGTPEDRLQLGIVYHNLAHQIALRAPRRS